MAEYPVNKGIGRPVEFKGLKAQSRRLPPWYGSRSG